MQSTNNLSFKKFIPAIAWFIVIFVLVTLPGKDIPKVDLLEEISFDKIVHMGIFGLLVVLFCWPFDKSYIPDVKKLRYFIIIAFLASAWGYCTELIQKFWTEIGRSYDIFDWIADSLGTLVGYIFSRKNFI
jgi:amino acid permease